MIKLGIVMDPIANINIKKDSSFAMLLEAQRRGYELHYMEMNDLYLINGEARARTRIVNVEQNYEKWYEFGTEQDIALADLNVILMRKDPPFDTEYIYSTYILERAEEKGTLIVNKPQSLRDCNEKLYTAWFSDLTPETLVTRSKTQLKEFWQKHGDIIMKPLDGMGGASIFRVKEGDPNIGVIAETLTELGTRYCMAQNYLPAIKDGDKRVLVVDGEPVPYCLARIPQGGETRGNLAAGGRGEPRPLSESDWEIARRVGPTLKAKGLIFVGLDIIGDRLTEVNVTSPTCIREIEAEFPIDHRNADGRYRKTFTEITCDSACVYPHTGRCRFLNQETVPLTMNLQHHFLIAMPALQDPIFRRAVVYICEYNEDGAMGIIINKPLENLQVEGILDKLKIPAEARLPEIRLDKPVMLGGPLAEDRGFILHTPPVFSSSIRISDNTVVTTSRDVLETLGTANQPSEVLVALGYASWEKGQLEQEILDNAWLTAPADMNILFKTPIADRWRDAAKLIGIDILTMPGVAGHA